MAAVSKIHVHARPKRTRPRAGLVHTFMHNREQSVDANVVTEKRRAWAMHGRSAACSLPLRPATGRCTSAPTSAAPCACRPAGAASSG